MTNDPGQRLREHKRSQSWWSEVSRQTLDEVPTRAVAFFNEATAILKEKPVYNVDVPSLSRYDILRSRTTAADPLTDEDRISSLEHQLREARRQTYRAASDEGALASATADNIALAAENAALPEVARVSAEDRRNSDEALLATVKIWQDLAESREQPRIFVVEGPRPTPGVAAPQTVVQPAEARRTLLQRIIGGHPAR